jgi:hypothetical protein
VESHEFALIDLHSLSITSLITRPYGSSVKYPKGEGQNKGVKKSDERIVSESDLKFTIFASRMYAMIRIEDNGQTQKRHGDKGEVGHATNTETKVTGGKRRTGANQCA